LATTEIDYDELCVTCRHRYGDHSTGCDGPCFGVDSCECKGFKRAKLPLTPSAFTSVVDSGKREQFSTGSVRDTHEGKGRFDLLSPEVLFRDAKHMENGAKKYGDRNWEKGQPVSRFMDSAFRHMVKFLRGDMDEDHLAAARWNLAGVIHTEVQVRAGKLPKELLDLPWYANLSTTPESK
jgi:hypothetical protein